MLSDVCFWFDIMAHNVRSLSRGATCHEGPLLLRTGGGRRWQVLLYEAVYFLAIWLCCTPNQKSLITIKIKCRQPRIHNDYQDGLCFLWLFLACQVAWFGYFAFVSCYVTINSPKGVWSPSLTARQAGDSGHCKGLDNLALMHYQIYQNYHTPEMVMLDRNIYNINIFTRIDGNDHNHYHQMRFNCASLNQNRLLLHHLHLLTEPCSLYRRHINNQ